MAEEKFILVSLKEDEAKKLAQVISNNTSRKILDILSDGSHTESEISEKLSLPLSTVHYNMQALLKAKLVQAEEYHYSKKGKEVLHYSLASKYVIIAPKDAPGNLKERLKRIIPAGLIAVAGAGAIELFNRWGSWGANAAPQAFDAAPEMLRIAEDDMAAKGVAMAEPMMHEPNLALWFLYGAVAMILVYLLIDWIYTRRQ